MCICFSLFTLRLYSLQNFNNMAQSIDLTPTWEGILPGLLWVLQDGDNEGKRIAKEELKRMAKAADLWNARPRFTGAPFKKELRPRVSDIFGDQV